MREHCRHPLTICAAQMPFVNKKNCLMPIFCITCRLPWLESTSMSKVSVVGQRVRRRMADLNITTIKELENIAGLPRDSVRHLVSGRTNSLRSGKLPALAAALKMSVEELVSGTAAAPEGAAVTVPVFNQSSHSMQIGRIRFDIATLRVFGTDTMAKLRLIVASGDNMHPTISAGDSVLIDSSLRNVSGDGIYCLQGSDGSLALRRVQVQASAALGIISSDNPKYMPEAGVDLSSVGVYGKVIGVYRSI